MIAAYRQFPSPATTILVFEQFLAGDNSLGDFKQENWKVIILKTNVCLGATINFISESALVVDALQTLSTQVF